MKFTRRGLFAMIAGAVVGTKAKPLIRPLPGGEALRYPATMVLKISKVNVVPRARKLKGTWTMEPMKDLCALHGIDPNTELTLL